MRSSWILVGVVLASSTALAAPVATAKLDVDADGAPEDLELGADGVLQIRGKRPASIKVAPSARAGRISATQRGRALIVVEITSSKGSEAAILGARGTAWRELLRVPVGGVGLDADYSVAIEARAEGVLRYQLRPGIRRCDGKPTLLFPEKLDVDKLRFVRVQPPVDVDPGAPTLAAKLDPAPTLVPLLYQARAASHQPGQTDAGGLGLPRELDDGKLDTAWREELGSDGRGQFFTFEPRAAGVEARQIRIVNGHHASAQSLRASRRLREIAIVTSAGSWRVALPDPAGDPLGTAHVIDLPQSIKGCVSIVIESTQGPDGAATAISSLEVFADGERAGGGGDAMLARMLAEGKVDTTNVAAALGRRGPAGVLAIETELGKTTDAGARRRLVGALVKIKDPSAMATLAKAARSGWVHDKDLLDVIRALAAGNQVHALRDLARENLATEYRVAAAAGISAKTPAGFEVLVELAGEGPPALRRMVIEQLAPAPASSLVSAANGTSEAAAAGDLWRALTRHARHDAPSRPEAIAAMTAALATTPDYERRYRLVDGLGAHGDAAALRTLDAFLRGLPPGPHSSALRQVAVRALASAPRAEAVTLVVDLARDADPGVRLATLAALAGSATDAAGPWHGAGGPDTIDRVIVNALDSKTERWPEVRRRAAEALASRCQRSGPRYALLAAVDRDPSLDVRARSLNALVECRAEGIRELLPTIWNHAKAPTKMRTYAVDLSVALGDAALGAQLVARLKQWRGEAIADPAALELAKSAAVAIGRLRPPGAAAALIDALGDSAFPEIVSAAALGLGALGKACPPDAKAALEAIVREGSQAAASARMAAGMCGR